jgi:CSLREA domain-containing protein
MAVVLLAVPATARAAVTVFHVNTTADVPDAAINGICSTGGTCNGVPCCSLRAAIMEANLDLSGQEVTIDLPAGTYKLLAPITVDNQSDGDLNLYGHVRIVGAGFDQSIVDANFLDRALFVSSSATVALSDLRIQNGLPPASLTRYGYGSGGGIYNDGGSVTLTRCLLRANAVTHGEYGGAIYSNGGTVALEDSAVRINAAPGGGAGIYASNATITLNRSAVYSNTASGGGGGGITQYGGSLTVTNSTISSNVALFGGGLDLVTGDAKLYNVTIVGNAATVTPELGADGFIYYTPVLLSNSIFGLYDNATPDAWGDIYCVGSSTVITSNGFNTMYKHDTCSITGTILPITPYLDSLALNGGLTATRAARDPALYFSFSVDAGDPDGCHDVLGAPLATDQRGVKRKIGAACDLGAFEFESIGDANGDGVRDVADVFYIINYLFAGGPVPLGRANVNGDAAIDVADVFYLINFLFAGGPTPQ